MAYLFNSLSDETGEVGKQNIFGGQQTDQGTTSGGAPAQGSSAPPPSSAGGGGAAAAPKAPAKQQTAAYNPQAASQAYSTAAKQIKMPQAFSQAEGTLAKGSQQLQEQADAYGKKAQETATGFGLDEATLTAATSGKGPEFQKTAERLRQADPSQQFEAFQGLQELPAIQNIRDPGSLFRAESGPGYSAGMSRFDAALLRRSPEFIARQRELLGQGKALEEQSKKAAETETQKARDLLKGEFERTTGDIRGKLGGMGEGIVSAAKAKSEAETAKRAGLDQKALSDIEEEKLKAQIKEELKGADPRSLQARSLQYLGDDYDLSPYLNIDRATDWREFIGSPEAQQYNAIQGLLGGGEMLTPSMAGAGPETEFDVGGAKASLLEQLKGKRQQQDIRSQEQIDRIIGEAQARAGQVGSGENVFQNALADLAKYGGEKYGTGEEGSRFGAELFLRNQGKDLVRERQAGAPVNWRDVLTAEQAQSLGSLTKDIGGLGEFQAGYMPGYDADALRSAYDAYRQGLAQDLVPAPAAPEPQRTGATSTGKQQTSKSKSK